MTDANTEEHSSQFKSNKATKDRLKKKIGFALKKNSTLFPFLMEKIRKDQGRFSCF